MERTKMVTSVHIIFTYKGKVYERTKNWNLRRIEKVLIRLGATYWELGVADEYLQTALNQLTQE